MEEQSPNKHPEKTWLEKGTEGLCASFNEPLGKTKVLQQVCEKQIDLADRVASENEKFVRIEEGLQISHMIEKTASYKPLCKLTKSRIGDRNGTYFAIMLPF